MRQTEDWNWIENLPKFGIYIPNTSKQSNIRIPISSLNLMLIKH